MDLIWIGFAALLASAVTLFSGFGLGTVLMPVFALFVPVPVAIAATAIVHLANNLFKLGLMARQADWGVVARFGVPAALAAVVGAKMLGLFSSVPSLYQYAIGTRQFEITAVKAVIGTLVVVFALLELSSRFQSLAFPARWLPVGGVLSGFFGGLSGNQGALRSAFLIRAGLSRDAFVATGVVSAVLVDAVRLTVYGTALIAGQFQEIASVKWAVAVGTVCAFAGAVLGKRVLQKVTLRAIQILVAVLMLLIGVGLVAGLV